jgi:hypothetical protein
MISEDHIEVYDKHSENSISPCQIESDDSFFHTEELFSAKVKNRIGHSFDKSQKIKRSGAQEDKSNRKSLEMIVFY